MSSSNGYFVYKHTNLINGKVNIGITRRAKPEDRWCKDGHRYAYNEHFYRAIRCIETGKVYKSVLDAANDLCIHESSIRQVCNGKRKSAGGYHFEDAK